MPCRSWSLNARETCPGSIERGELVPACQGCYAASGNYRFSNVRKPRDENRDDWKRAAWVDEMVAELDAAGYFRWFDSGDVYHVRLAEKILQVMERTPWCRHWLPTRSHKFAKFSAVFSRMEALPNVVVRRSSDSISGETIPGATTSTIVPPEADVDDVTMCEASTRGGKCGPCRACWDKTIPVIGYPAHGRSMLKLIATGG